MFHMFLSVFVGIYLEVFDNLLATVQQIMKVIWILFEMSIQYCSYSFCHSF
ncbi:MAG: hypothetical protein RMJ36_06495 [Candidatus Calescibacterium sp.]|nr:hypothetical protein [Candidatus Calescibacterium sp.]MDW8133284.1 hypothetical protein [Candidatus Calescibacterium sp.]